MSTGVPVVSLTVHEGKFSRYSIEKGKEVLKLDVLGDRHSLKDVAGWIFEYYARAVRREGLNAHLWRFELCKYWTHSLALASSVPLLSDKMMAREAFEMDFEEPRKCRIRDGSELVFVYDEGDTMYLRISVQVSIKDDATAIEAYPIVGGVARGKQQTADNTAQDGIKPEVTAEVTVVTPAGAGAGAEEAVAVAVSSRDRSQGNGNSTSTSRDKNVDPTLWSGDFGRESDDDSNMVDSEEELLKAHRARREEAREGINLYLLYLCSEAPRSYLTIQYHSHIIFVISHMQYQSCYATPVRCVSAESMRLFPFPCHILKYVLMLLYVNRAQARE
jgi:hypothetical protein